MQPLYDLIAKLNCNIEKLVAAMTGKTTGGESAVVPIIVQPPRADDGRTYEIPIQTTATLISAKNAKRINILMVNGGAATVYVGFNNTVTVTGGSNPGTPLLSQGVFSNDTYIGNIWAIAAAAGVTLGVWEEYSQ